MIKQRCAYFFTSAARRYDVLLTLHCKFYVNMALCWRCDVDSMLIRRCADNVISMAYLHECCPDIVKSVGCFSDILHSLSLVVWVYVSLTLWRLCVNVSTLVAQWTTLCWHCNVGCMMKRRLADFLTSTLCIVSALLIWRCADDVMSVACWCHVVLILSV